MINPSNYRGITLLSCLGKLFTSLLNDRLNEYLDVFGILSFNQAAFRKNHSITDHIFTMKCLIDQFFNHRKKLYCVFIDFEKAFDTIWRKALWHKLIQQGVSGKILQVIHNIYQNAKSTIELNGENSDYFQSFQGIRQGENLSPILFSMFVNDLEQYLEENQCDSLKFCRNDNTHWFKLFLLLYADDTVLLAETPEALQLMLNNVNEYCKRWKLKINVEKTKAIIFQKRKNLHPPKFYLDGGEIELVDSFRYLGVILNYNGSFSLCRKTLVSHASKAMFFVLKKVRQYSMDVDLAIQLFDSMVTPILTTFNCEVWGYENLDILERVQLKFYKYLLKLKKGTPNIFIYGELGRCPLETTVKCRMVKYWAKLLNSPKLSSRMYTIIFASHQNGKTSKWIECIQRILEHNGLGDFWLGQRCPNPEYLSLSLSTRLRDQYIQRWATSVSESRLGIFYRSFKTEFGFEDYLRVLPDDLRIPLCRFRCSNHPLPIEMGRYDGSPREDRLCTKCDMHCIGDDFHFILQCPFFDTLRSKYIKPYYKRNPSMLKYGQLFNSSGRTRKNLALFIRNGLKAY
ncbi:MAG: reverse transcriptase family protein [Candidatus Neomarinimicrobiota bacterium]